jgi:hypothetical protein
MASYRRRRLACRPHLPVRVYRAMARADGSTVSSRSPDAAMPVIEFKTDIRKLIAVRLMRDHC